MCEMTQQQVMEYANERLNHFGLTEKGWTFHLNNRRGSFGVCKYGPKRIELAKWVLSNEDKAKDTINHEIAHALAGYGTGHGRVWKYWCSITGARPVTGDTGEGFEVPKGNWRAVCSSCGHEHDMTRKTNRMKYKYCGCANCKGTRKEKALRWKNIKTGETIIHDVDLKEKADQLLADHPSLGAMVKNAIMNNGGPIGIGQ